MNNNCHGCKYLYLNGEGYSDWTWMETYVTCALNLNPHLPIEEPYEFGNDPVPTLRFLATFAQECGRYDAGETVTVTPDGNIRNFTDDDEQMRAIIEHQGGDAQRLTKCRRTESVHGYDY